MCILIIDLVFGALLVFVSIVLHFILNPNKDSKYQIKKTENTRKSHKYETRKKLSEFKAGVI